MTLRAFAISMLSVLGGGDVIGEVTYRTDTQQLLQRAAAYWRRPSPCGGNLHVVVVRFADTAKEYSGATAPGDCVILVSQYPHTDRDSLAFEREARCGVLAHEIGHLHGYGHDVYPADPQRIMKNRWKPGAFPCTTPASTRRGGHRNSMRSRFVRRGGQNRGMQTVDLPTLHAARNCVRASEDELRSWLGSLDRVVYFVQRRVDGPIKIGTSARMTFRVDAFLRDSPDPVILRALVPGGQPLESWFHRRHRTAGRHLRNEWFEHADTIVDDAYAFTAAMRSEYEASEDLSAATAHAVCAVDQETADLVTLYRNKVTLRAIGELSGMAPAQVRARIEHLRRLGFELGCRRVYASRSPRLEGRVPSGGVRCLG